MNGAEIPAVFGGKYRQAEVYVNPYKLLSRQLSLMDVVKAVNKGNLILPAGDVKVGPVDFYVYSNSLVQNVSDLNNLPVKTDGASWVSVGDIGEAKDSSQLQYNIVRIDGQKSAYIPIMKSGGDTTPSRWSTTSTHCGRICSACPSSWSPTLFSISRYS